MTTSGESIVTLEEKQSEFNAAMQLYTTRTGYKLFGSFISVANVFLQVWLLWRVLPISIGIVGQVIAISAAWLLADFVNGLVHMYMDNNDRYDAFYGPLVANFHLHHKTPRYKPKKLPVVYFVESGSKVWLVPCLFCLALAAEFAAVSPLLLHILVYAGILSSLAEVSHYLCHTSMSPIALRLGNAGILLSKKRHAVHHMQDNMSYAFLNGLTDPLINLIAARSSRGYKQNTDLHYATYYIDTESR